MGVTGNLRPQENVSFVGTSPTRNSHPRVGMRGEAGASAPLSPFISHLHMQFRGTSHVRNRPPPYEHNRALGMILL